MDVGVVTAGRLTRVPLTGRAKREHRVEFAALRIDAPRAGCGSRERVNRFAAGAAGIVERTRAGVVLSLANRRTSPKEAKVAGISKSVNPSASRFRTSTRRSTSTPTDSTGPSQRSRSGSTSKTAPDGGTSGPSKASRARTFPRSRPRASPISGTNRSTGGPASRRLRRRGARFFGSTESTRPESERSRASNPVVNHPGLEESSGRS